MPSGELPEGLSGSPNGNKFVISRTISQNAEARNYEYTVRARNEAGTSEAMTIRSTVTKAGSEMPNAAQVPAKEIANMTDNEIAETIGNNTEVALTGNVENLSKTIVKLETLMGVKMLDLLQIIGVSELKLDQTTLENIILEGNQSIKTVDIIGSTTLTELNLSRSVVKTVNVKDCESLKVVNLEGCESLETLDCSNNETVQ